MKLSDWLTRHNVKRADFARRIGVSPGAITQICRDEGAWISRETAELIFKETRGAVTPNDFLGAVFSPNQESEMSHSVTEAVEALAAGEIVIVTDDEGAGCRRVVEALSARIQMMLRHRAFGPGLPLPLFLLVTLDVGLTGLQQGGGLFVRVGNASETNQGKCQCDFFHRRRIPQRSLPPRRARRTVGHVRRVAQSRYYRLQWSDATHYCRSGN